MEKRTQTPSFVDAVVNTIIGSFHTKLSPETKSLARVTVAKLSREKKVKLYDFLCTQSAYELLYAFGLSIAMGYQQYLACETIVCDTISELLSVDEDTAQLILFDTLCPTNE